MIHEDTTPNEKKPSVKRLSEAWSKCIEARPANEANAAIFTHDPGDWIAFASATNQGPSDVRFFKNAVAQECHDQLSWAPKHLLATAASASAASDLQMLSRETSELSR